MKRYIYSSSSQTATLYHGGPLAAGSKLEPIIVMRDLGLHVGSFEQAQSHDRNHIIEVDVVLKNIVKVPDLGNWNNPRSVSDILHAKGVDISVSDLTMMFREAYDKTPYYEKWQVYSKLFTQLLVDNGISVIQYENTKDEIRDTSYCIVDPSCIVDISLVNTIQRLGYNSYGTTEQEDKAWAKLPDWAKDVTISFKKVPTSRTVAGGYVLIIQPIAGDPDKHPKIFEHTAVAGLLKQLNNYYTTFEAEVAPRYYWI